MLRKAYTLSRPQKLFVICAAIFITALVVAEATASKFFTAFELPFTVTILGAELTRVTMTAGVIAFAGQLAFAQIVAITLFNYAYKFIIAVAITPVIYLAHWMMDAYLGHETAEALIERAEEGDGLAKETLKPSTRGAA